MSDIGRAHVIQNSPYRGATFFVHYFLGDLANADHDYELWLSMRGLAKRIRMTPKTVNTAVATLLADGHLEEVERQAGGRVRYRFVIENALPQAIPKGRISGDNF